MHEFKNRHLQKMLTEKSTCIIGIGNPLRSDDGAGSYVCKLIEEKKIPGVTLITTHQLDIGITEDLSKYDTVIFVDASLKEDTISFQPLSLDNDRSQSFSHRINAGMLVSLVHQLFETKTKFYICAIGVSDFEIGNGLSEKTMSNALEAFSLLITWIQTND